MTQTTSAKDRILDAAERLVHDHGFNATTVDAILDEAGASKGAFFHHFSSKDALGEALVDRYAAADAALLEETMAKAEAASEDPAEQLVEFLRLYEALADDTVVAQPGCLFVSFIYERGPSSPREDDVILWSIELWRQKILEKLNAAAVERPQLRELDLPALADQVFSIFEGGFILVRATGEPSHLRRQLAHLRRYFELLLGVDTAPAG